MYFEQNEVNCLYFNANIVLFYQRIYQIIILLRLLKYLFLVFKNFRDSDHRTYIMGIKCITQI